MKFASLTLATLVALASFAVTSPSPAFAAGMDAELSVRLSPWRDPSVGRDSDSVIEIPYYSAFVTRFRRDRTPAYQSDLRVWIQLPGFVEVTPRTDVPFEIDPVDSPFEQTPSNHTVAIGLEERDLSFAIRLRPETNALLDRWIHIHVKAPKPILYVDPICMNAGFQMEPATPTGNGGAFAWLSFACVMVEKNSKEKRLFGLLRHSADSQIVARRFGPIAESGKLYELIDLVLMGKNKVAEFEIRRPGDVGTTRVLISRQKDPPQPSARFTFSFGPALQFFNGANGASQNQLAPQIQLQFRQRGIGKKIAFIEEFEASSLPIAKSESSLPMASYMSGSLRVEIPIRYCPFELLDLPCSIEAGASVWGMPGVSYGPSALFGPDLRLTLHDGALPTTRHTAYFRFSPLFGAGTPLSFSNRELAFGARFLIGSRLPDRDTWLDFELNQVTTSGVSGFDSYRFESLLSFSSGPL